jgi:CubicO group peptidase (beta-lactamase class C family)
MDAMLSASRETMRTATSVGFVCILLAAILTLAGPSSDGTLPAHVDLIFVSVVQPNDPGAAVLVKKDGKILFEKGYGVRDLRSHAKIDPETNFRLASFTKQFTAMAIMLLVHDGKLHYDDQLTLIFPDFPAYGKDITIRNLLNHTSGLPDYAEIMDQQEKSGGPKWSPDHQIQDEEILQLVNSLPVPDGSTATPATSFLV